MDTLKIGSDEYNLEFVEYGEPTADGFTLHFVDGGTVTHAMSADKAAQVHALLPENKRAKPEPKGKKAKEASAEAEA